MKLALFHTLCNLERRSCFVGRLCKDKRKKKAMKCLKCAAVFSEGRVAFNFQHGDSLKGTLGKEMTIICFPVPLPL